MVRIIQTLALGAGLVTLITCIWRDYGILAALPRVALAYLATFFLGALVAIAARLLADAVAARPQPAPVEAKAPGGRRRRTEITTSAPTATATSGEPAGPADDAA